jgi:polar amino acid transport system permease protein
VRLYRFRFADVFVEWEFLWEGLLFTLWLSGLTIVIGLLIGCAAAAAMVYGGRALRLAVTAYVEAIRNTPLIVQLFLVFFGLPSLGLRFSAETASLVTLSINLGAYTAEIVRAGLEAIPKTQVEAGQSLGLTPLQIFRYVVFFPAVRIVYPALASQFVLLVLATSVVSQISAQDLFQAGSIIQSRTFRDFEVYAVIAGAYLAMALLLRGIFALVYQLAFARR